MIGQWAYETTAGLNDGSFFDSDIKLLLVSPLLADFFSPQMCDTNTNFTLCKNSTSKQAN